MAHFLGVELTKELENLNDDINANINVEPQQDKGTNSQDNEESGNTGVNPTDEEINDEIMKNYEGPEWVNVSKLGDTKLQLQLKT